MIFLLATTNPRKIATFRDIVSPFATQIITPADVGDYHEPDENGSSILENAQIKASYWSEKYPDYYCISSDGGLFIPTLTDWNPLHPRRFAGPDANDKDRADLLIQKMAHLTGEGRRADWREAVTIFLGGKELAHFEAEDQGYLGMSYDDSDLSGDGFYLDRLWHYGHDSKPLHELASEENYYAYGTWGTLKKEIQKYLAQRNLC